MLRFVLAGGLVLVGCSSVFGLEDPQHRTIDAAIDAVPDAAIDTDNDQVPDVTDNCDAIANTDQIDSDADLVGDACDACPNLADNQHDEDGDGIGDRCDNCPTIVNAMQKNTDQDGLGDECDGSSAHECIIRFDGFVTLDRWTAVRGTWVIENDTLVQPDPAVVQALIETDEVYNLPRVDALGTVADVGTGAVAIGVWGNATTTVDTQNHLPDGTLADLFENGTARVIAVTDVSGGELTTLGAAQFPSNVDIGPGIPFLILIDLMASPMWGMAGILGTTTVTTNAMNSSATPNRVGLRVHNASVRFQSVTIIERRAVCPTPLQ